MSNVLIGCNALAATFAAAIFMHVVSSNAALVAAFLVTYAVYSYDRSKGGPEDEINRMGKPTGGKWLPAMAYLAAIVLYSHPIVLLPAVAGFLYTVTVPHLGRPKDLPGAKSIIVSSSVAGFVVGLLGWSWPVFAFMFLSVFVNSVICDIRDIEGDGLHGVRTIPVMLGAKRTKLLLAFLASCMWFFLPLSILSMIAIAFSYMQIGLRYRDVLVDADWIMVTGIYLVISQVLHI